MHEACRCTFTLKAGAKLHQYRAQFIVVAIQQRQHSSAITRLKLDAARDEADAKHTQ